MAGLTDTTIVGCFPEQQQLAGNPVFGEGILRVVKLESPDSPLEFYHMREARRRVVAAFNRSAIAIDVVSIWFYRSAVSRMWTQILIVTL